MLFIFTVMAILFGGQMAAMKLLDHRLEILSFMAQYLKGYRLIFENERALLRIVERIKIQILGTVFLLLSAGAICT